jgi:hypothetical protein
MNTQRKLKPFTGDLRQIILDACAEVGGGTVEGYLDKVVRDDAERGWSGRTSSSTPSAPRPPGGRSPLEEDIKVANANSEFLS